MTGFSGHGYLRLRQSLHDSASIFFLVELMMAKKPTTKRIKIQKRNNVPDWSEIEAMKQHLLEAEQIAEAIGIEGYETMYSNHSGGGTIEADISDMLYTLDEIQKERAEEKHGA